MSYALNIPDLDTPPAAEQGRIPAHPELPGSPAQKAELHRRLQAHDQDRSQALDWEAVELELLGPS